VLYLESSKPARLRLAESKVLNWGLVSGVPFSNENNGPGVFPRIAKYGSTALQQVVNGVPFLVLYFLLCLLMIYLIQCPSQYLHLQVMLKYFEFLDVKMTMPLSKKIWMHYILGLSIDK